MLKNGVKRSAILPAWMMMNNFDADFQKLVIPAKAGIWIPNQVGNDIIEYLLKNK